MAEKHVYWSEKTTIYQDAIGTVLCYTACRLMMKFLMKIHNMALIDVHLLRKLLHLSIGLIVMLCWPIFSSSVRGRVLGSLIMGFLFRKAIIEGFGRPKTYETDHFLRKQRDSRALLKAVLGYILGNAFAAIVHLRRTNLAIAVVCNLCAGDGVADIIGRRLGSRKLPYNKDKSYAGSIGMAIVSFLASIIFRWYFTWWGYIEEGPNMVLGFLMVSIASAVVESHPLSTIIEDNLTVPVASILVGSFVL